MGRVKKAEGSVPENGGGQAGRTAAAAAAAPAAAPATATNPNGMDGGSDDGDKKTPPGVAQNGDDERGNTLWEQMTAREGRDAARRAGMSVGDWQAERQLQEALRESAQEAGGAPAPNGAGADTGGEERSFVDAGFHALATSAVEAEEERAGAPPPLEERQQQQHASRNTNGAHGGKGGGSGKGRDSHDRSAMMYSVDGVAAAAAAEVVASSGKTSHPKVAGSLGEAAAGAGGDEKEEDEEDFGEVELVVTHDGGIIPVAAAAAAAAVDGDDVSADGTAPKPEKTPTVQGKGKGARKGGIRDGVEVGGSDDDAAVGSVRKIAAGKTSVGREKGGGGGDHDEEEEEGDGEGEEEERPLPPDIMLTLADDVLHRVMLFLNPEDIFECRVVSSRWEFPSHEAVFEGLCRRTYLAQSAKKLLNVKRWRSWERMYKFRPRLRDTGLYSLKTTYYKKPVRDMSTEWIPGKILKVTYYRYFRFFGDGRVAYGLMHEGPKEFVRMLQEGSPKVVYGTYTISKWEVNVEIPNPWSWVSFTLQLANGERGRFTHLVMLRHSSVPRNDARAGRCHHSVKSSDFFTFRRVWQF